MKRFASLLVVCCLMVVVRPAVAAAQAIPGFDWAWGDKVERVDANHWRVIGAAEFWQGQTKFNADKADYYEDTHRLIASGHVTVAQADAPGATPTSVISAQAMDFNTETQTGIFYNAWGLASLGNRVDRAMFGTLEPDMYFYGDVIEKIGRKKYRITHGGFTTCVQPVPRWELTSGSVVISFEHYALLRNSVLRVKGVPLFYLPILYYPTKKEERATGVLLPTYGTSTLKGFTLSNAFFWAISRSQDLTVLHDWFTKTGQGIGGEYRYVLASASQGILRMYLLNEHELITANPGGTTTTTPAKRSYQINGSASEMLNKYVRASGRVSYFTDIIAQQTYNTNIYDASRSQRTISGNVTGSWGGYRITGSFDRSELFTGSTNSTLAASTPRISVSRSERPIGNLPIYVTLGGEYVDLQRGSTTSTTVGTATTTTVTRLAVSRIDFSPTVRVPFTKLPFLTVNSSVNWRGTFWTKSWDANHNVLDQSISRRLFDLQSNITGPVFTRVFNTPDSGYAEKLKHTIEPYVNLRYTTAFPDFDRIVQWESADGIVGGTTQITYGVNNRLYAKRKSGGSASAAREILNVGIGQTYYSNARASQFDPQYSSSFTGVKPFNFSPIALVARALPTDQINATLRAEWDTQFGFLRTVSAGSTYSVGNWLGTSAAWTLTRSFTQAGLSSVIGRAVERPGSLIPIAGGFRPLALSSPASTTTLNHFLSGNANVRLAQNKYGGNYSLNYDVHNTRFVQQRITGYYNAQCCGFAIEYQTFNFGTLPGVRVPQDRRFNFSFTLAGIGSFSNFFGALSGATR